MNQSTITVGGKTYRLEGGKYHNLDHWEATIIGLRPDPFALLKAIPTGVSEDIQKDLARRAFNASMEPRFVTAVEGEAFDSSLRGRVWNVWNALQAHHAEEFPTLESAAALLEMVTTEANAPRSDVEGTSDSKPDTQREATVSEFN